MNLVTKTKKIYLQFALIFALAGIVESRVISIVCSKNLLMLIRLSYLMNNKQYNLYIHYNNSISIATISLLQCNSLTL